MALFEVSINECMCVEANSKDEAWEVFLSHIRADDAEIHEIDGFHHKRCELGHRPWRKLELSPHTCSDLVERAELERERLEQEQEAADA